MTIQQIQEHPVYKKVIADSFGGVVYNEANRGKYNAEEVIQLWDQLTDAQRGVAGGIMQGALNFLKGE